MPPTQTRATSTPRPALSGSTASTAPTSMWWREWTGVLPCMSTTRGANLQVHGQNRHKIGIPWHWLAIGHSAIWYGFGLNPLGTMGILFWASFSGFDVYLSSFISIDAMWCNPDVFVVALLWDCGSLCLCPFSHTQCGAMLVPWTSLGRLEAAQTSVCWGTATRPAPAAVAPGSAWVAMASPARVSAMIQNNTLSNMGS